jgi:hypothetical protein
MFIVIFSICLLLQKSSKSKKKWFGKQKLQTSDPSLETDTAPPLPPPEDIKLTDIENQISHHNVAEITTAVVDEKPGPSVQAPVIRTEAVVVSRFAGKQKDEVAAIKIQTAFRGYLVCVANSPSFLNSFDEFFFVIQITYTSIWRIYENNYTTNPNNVIISCLLIEEKGLV